MIPSPFVSRKTRPMTPTSKVCCIPPPRSNALATWSRMPTGRSPKSAPSCRPGLRMLAPSNPSHPCVSPLALAPRSVLTRSRMRCAAWIRSSNLELTGSGAYSGQGSKAKTGHRQSSAVPATARSLAGLFSRKRMSSKKPGGARNPATFPLMETDQ